MKLLGLIALFALVGLAAGCSDPSTPTATGAGTTFTAPAQVPAAHGRSADERTVWDN